jgi:uncharacterized repeat protein (TIGR02543 family)
MQNNKIDGMGVASSITIKGGSVDIPVVLFNGVCLRCIAAQPTNGSVNVYKNTLTLPVALSGAVSGSYDEKSFTTGAGTAANYGVGGLNLSSKTFHFWLPANNNAAANVTITGSGDACITTYRAQYPRLTNVPSYTNNLGAVRLPNRVIKYSRIEYEVISPSSDGYLPCKNPINADTVCEQYGYPYVNGTVSSYTPQVLADTVHCGLNPISIRPYIDVNGNSACVNGHSFEGWSHGLSEYEMPVLNDSIAKKVWDVPVTYHAGQPLSYAEAANVNTLYARCTANTYTVYLLKNASEGIIDTGANSVRVPFGATMPPATPPTRNGYTFEGYYLTLPIDRALSTLVSEKYYDKNMRANQNGLQVSKWYYTQDSFLYADWMPINYWVRYHSNTNDQVGSMPDDKINAMPQWNQPSVSQWNKCKYVYDSISTIDDSIPVRRGYTFLGWNTDARKNDASLIEYVPSQVVLNLTSQENGIFELYAMWRPNQYKINFDKRGGIGGHSYIVATYDDTVPPASAPLRSNYVFIGYYTDTLGNGTCYYDVNMRPRIVWKETDSITLYAMWRSVTMPLPLDKMGGTGGTDAVIAIYPNPMPTHDLAAPTRVGYTFDGYWSTPSGGKQYYYADMTSDVNWDALHARLYAHWIPDTFNIYFNHNFAGDSTTSIGARVDTVRVIFGETFNVPYPVRAGYGYLYWVYYANYAPGSAKFYETMLCDFAHDTTLYAIWDRDVCHITFNTNYEGMTKAPRAVKFAEPIGFLPTPTPRQEYGYHFMGWFYPDTTLLSKRYTENSIYDITIGVGNCDAEFQARWDANPHIFCLQAEGGKVYGTDSLRRDILYNASVGYLQRPERKGADFLGYYDAPMGYYGDSVGQQLNHDDIYVWDYDRTFYAHWYLRTDTIRLDPRGGACTPQKIPVRYGSPVGALPVPVREGYAFLGWRTDAPVGSDPIIVNDTSIYNTDGNLTVYAMWRRNTYNVRFVSNGYPDTVADVLYGDKVARPQPDPVLADRVGTNLHFEGWYRQGMHPQRWNFDTDTVTEHITLTAHWATEHPFIDRPPVASLTYGQTLDEALLKDGEWSFNDDRTGNGHFAFTSPQIYPSVADSAVTRYEIGFFPDDSLYYSPVYDSITVNVSRRPLTIAARSASLLLQTNNVLRAPGGWSDIQSYIVRRYDIEGIAPQEDGFLIYVHVRLKHDYSYYAARPGIYEGEVTATGGTLLDNYDVTCIAGNLYVSRINFLPSESIIYGNTMALNATHVLPQYTSGLTYSSSRPDLLDVRKNTVTGQWEAEAKHTGTADVCVYFAGDPKVEAYSQPDTNCVAIRVTPRRGIRIKASNMTRIFGIPLPARFPLEPIEGLDASEVESLYEAGLRVIAVNTPSDTPPGGMYNIMPGGINHPNYADFNYQGGTLIIMQGGDVRQKINFVLPPATDTFDIAALQLIPDSLPSVDCSDAQTTVWAVVASQHNQSRRVIYESSAPNVASILPADTMRIDIFGDTIWGAVLRIHKAGATEITAYNEGDAEYRAVYTVRTQNIFKVVDTVEFAAPVLMDAGQKDTLHGTAKSGLPVYFYISGGDTAAATISGNILTAVHPGIVKVSATQRGNAIYAERVEERTVEILAPNAGVLLSLKLSGGTLMPAFSPNKIDYEYNLPCTADTLTMHCDRRNTVEVFSTTEGEAEVDSTFVVEAFAKDIQLEIRVKTPSKQTKTYTFRVRAPLPKEYIYYAPQTFGNRMEVVNNPTALGGKRFYRYQWFEDGVLLPNQTGGVLYRDGGFNVGSVYSAYGVYDPRYSYTIGGFNDSVYICGQIAVKASNGLEVYPNPAYTYITVRHPDIGKTDAPIVIYNSVGSEMASYPPQSIVIDPDNHSATIDISALPEGASYVVKFLNASVIITKRGG